MNTPADAVEAGLVSAEFVGPFVSIVALVAVCMLGAAWMRKAAASL